METILLSDIIRDDRMRRQYNDIPELAESLWTKGFIQPIAITPDKQLIAGGRRSAALDYILANSDEFSSESGEASMLEFRIGKGLLRFGIHFTFKVAETFAALSELELIENIQRDDMTWQEEVLGIAKIHNLRRQQVARGELPDVTSWGQRETGRLFKISMGNVNYTLKLAEHLADEKSPLWACDSATEALQYLVKLKHDEVSQALTASIRERANHVPVIPGYTPPPTGDIDFIKAFDPAAYAVAGGVAGDPSSEYVNSPVPNTPSVAESGSKTEQHRFEEAIGIVSKFIHLGKCEDVFSKAVGVCDHIICDPPYAIEMSNLEQANIDRVEETHDVQNNLADIPKWLRACWSATKDKAFVVWWCDAMNFRYIHDEAIKVGFRVQRWPLTWVKTSSCMNQRAEFNTTKNTEIAIVMRKPGAKLVQAQGTSVFIGQLAAEDKEACPNHPFIKPRELWQWLFKMIALPGSTIGDPFSGVGSMTRAALLDGYTPFTCEMDEKHYNQQLINAANTYLSI